MKKLRLTTLAKELGIDVNQLVKLKGQKLSPENYTGFGKNTWLTVEGAEILRIAVEAPLACPNKFEGVVIGPCRNSRWVYVKIDGKEGRTPVQIDRRWHAQTMVGKRIRIDAITDAQGGTTYCDERRTRP